MEFYMHESTCRIRKTCVALSMPLLTALRSEPRIVYDEGTKTMKQILAGLTLMLLLTGCGGSPPAAKKVSEPEKPPEPVTGRYAMNQLYIAARNWQPDVQPLQLTSQRIAQVKDEPGKSGVWQAIFVSAAQQKARTYTYSIVEVEPSLHKGVFPGLAENYTGPSGGISPFLMPAVRTDSDHAYEVALKHSEKYAKANPDMPVLFLLQQPRELPNVAWRVIWGESVNMSGWSVYVDASTGEYVKTLH